MFTSRGHLVTSPRGLDRDLLPRAVLEQLGHPLALPDAVQEQEVPPGVLRQVLVSLHPLTQKGKIRMELFCSSLAAVLQVSNDTVRTRLEPEFDFLLVDVLQPGVAEGLDGESAHHLLHLCRENCQ